uniref:Nucleoprotein TPR-like n=1 Tax=Saccoglossus kowalevskii TaxID=10224 RepID=A0ABM0M5B3_SACKO|nr:PREDICTED: nucleoprotein TPR-like [Saccoglossus kowalevskii]
MDNRKKASSNVDRYGKKKSSTSSSRLMMGVDESYAAPSGLTNQRTDSAKSREINKIQTLKEENEKLKQEIEELRSLYTQLITDKKQEKFEERRVQILKAQIIQLERQILLHSEGLSSRSKILLEVENSMSAVTGQLRDLLATETRGPVVSLERSQLTNLIENIESSRHKLYKNIECYSADNVSKPLLFMDPFCKETYQDSINVLDVCSGSTNHINLKQVAKLESKLFHLHHKLYSLQQSMELCPTSSNLELNSEHLSHQLVNCKQLLDGCCHDLLCLSILIPAAPWAVLHRPALGEFTSEKIMKSLPNFVKSQQQQGRIVIEALIKAVNYSLEVGNQKLHSIVESLTPMAESNDGQGDSERLSTLSEFCTEFFTSLDKVHEESVRKHKKQTKKVEQLEQQESDILKETLLVMEEVRIKKEEEVKRKSVSGKEKLGASVKESPPK